MSEMLGTIDELSESMCIDGEVVELEKVTNESVEKPPHFSNTLKGISRQEQTTNMPKNIHAQTKVEDKIWVSHSLKELRL